jgi:predicted esterase
VSGSVIRPGSAIRQASRIGALFLLFLFAATGKLTRAANPEENGYPTGRIVDRIACRSDPRFSFALYLPSRFDPARCWPLLLVLDPRGRGAAAAERFREAAEDYGWILVSSNDTKSDDATTPNADILQALWTDAFSRFPADPKRTYAARFSGGARLAFLIALARPGSLAGVIASGGGLPAGSAIRSTPGFSVFATAGNTDFNYQEMLLDATLEKYGAARRLATFDGGHEWLPAPIAREAIEWLEVRAMKNGLRPRDEKLAAEIYGRDLARVERLETSGETAAAFVLADRAAADFTGLVPVEGASEAVSRLREKARKPVEAALRRDARERAAVDRDLGVFNGALAAFPPPPAQTVARRMDLAALQKQAATGEPEERLSARRVIENLYVQAAFYRPASLLAAKEPARAALSLEIAVLLKPDRPAPWYDLACARALSGNGSLALEALRTAVEKGYRDAGHLASDEDLRSIRERPEFRALVEKISGNP